MEKHWNFSLNYFKSEMTYSNRDLFLYCFLACFFMRNLVYIFWAHSVLRIILTFRGPRKLVGVQVTRTTLQVRHFHTMIHTIHFGNQQLSLITKLLIYFLYLYNCVNSLRRICICFILVLAPQDNTTRIKGHRISLQTK